MPEAAYAPDIGNMRAEAAAWMVRLSSAAGAELEGLRAACDAWRAQDPRHETVFRQMEQLWHAVSPSPVKRLRKRAAAGGIIALAILFAAQLLPLAEWKADQHTRMGEVRRVPLADGSVITLNGRSAVDVEFNGNQRVIRLIAGEVLAEVAKDPAGRPFIVDSRDGTARALGTRYIVRQDEDETTVTVLESKVAVASGAHPDRPVVVHAGEQVRFNAEHVGIVGAAKTGADGWLNARLVFDDVPLSRVISELSNQRRGVLRVNGSVAGLRFTGVLPADDTDTALQMLMRALPVQVRSITPYLVWLEPVPPAKP